jgi:hypothetical protein
VNPLLFGESDTGDPFGLLLNFVWLASFVLFMFYGNKIQTWNMLREVGGAVNRLKVLKDEARKTTIETIKSSGSGSTDPTPRVDHFLEYFSTMPISLDPAGIVPKIEYIFDVRRRRFKDEITIIAPDANEIQSKNLEGLLDHTIGLNQIYRIVRHFYIQGRRTMSPYVILQVQMQLPIIMQFAEAIAGSIKVFSEGQPMGDGAGALVAAKMMFGHKYRTVAENVIASELSIDNRRVYVLKAEGPGVNVGKPGDGVKNIIDENNGEISLIIMIDAASKFEGEESGETAEGSGPVIGGIGVDQYKIEEETLKYKIPIHSVIIKQSIQESLTLMTKKIYDGVEVAIARVRRLIKEQSKEGDTVIVFGVGNTIGIGQ